MTAPGERTRSRELEEALAYGEEPHRIQMKHEAAILAAEVRRLEAELCKEQEVNHTSMKAIAVSAEHDVEQHGRIEDLAAKLHTTQAAMAEIRGALEFATWTLARTKTGEPAWCTSCDMHYPDHMDSCLTKKAIASHAGREVLERLEKFEKWKPQDSPDVQEAVIQKLNLVSRDALETQKADNSNLADQVNRMAKERDGWMNSAAEFSRGMDFYRGLVSGIGAQFGDVAYISNDGSKQQDVLCLKVPELVQALRANLASITAERDRMREALEWRPMESAPKGYPVLEKPSEWFLARGGNGPNGFNVAVIRRCFGHGFGPWECTGDAYYKADFFTQWMQIPGPALAPASPDDKKGAA